MCELWNIMLSGRSWTQMDAFYITAFIWSIQSKRIHKDKSKNRVVVARGWGWGGMREQLLMGRSFPSGVTKIASKRLFLKILRLDSLNLSNSFIFYITFKLRKRILPRLQYLQTGVLLYSQVPEFQKYFSLFSSFEKKGI